ncbi:hypothetical protein SLS60_002505 [Paraconiothyrium brasiliense]|uniref:NB-ARC domain-containing protein n=1 Tax=Paraconiothyrium brasiliense TaxID=300254 RepID=A0ABR3S2C8_9PLEO
MLKQLKPIESDDKSTQLRSLCLSGMGGLGKTELAYQFAKSCQNTYDVIMIVKSDTTFRLKRTFSKLAAKVGLLSDTEKPSDDEYREALKAWLKRPYRMPAPTSTTTGQSKESESIIAKWLLIFDNVEHWADLKPYWPEKGCGSVLVTTRKPDLLSHFETPECVVSLELRPLPKQDAIKLLSHFAGSDPASSPHVEGAAQDLCVRLGGLPLAVMQVGAYIKQCKLTILEFCQAHPKESDLYTIYLDEHRVEDYEYSLASVWALQPSSTGGGSLEQPSRLLCIMSLLDPEGIREELLKPDAAVDEVSGYPTSEPEFIRHYRALINASLVEKTQKSKFTIHRLVQKVTRAQIARDETLSEQVFNQTLRRLTDRWPYVNRIYQIGTQGHVDRWKSCKKWSPHVYALSQAYTEFRERGRLNKPSLELAELLYELAVYDYKLIPILRLIPTRYFSETSQPKEASRILDISESICSSAKGMTDTSEHDLRIYRGRIGVAFILRDGEAYLHYAKKELAAETARSTKPSSALAGANLHIGIAYGFNFLWKEARKYFKISMKIREEMPGFKKDWLFSPYYQLAHAYYHLNKNEKAALCLENAISDRVEAFGQTDSYSMRLVKSTWPGRLILMLKELELSTIHLAMQYLDEILPHYRMADYLHPYICRTAFLYAKTLPATDPERTKLLEEATRVFNSYSKYEKRTTDTLTELDAQSLVAYDYL